MCHCWGDPLRGLIFPFPTHDFLSHKICLLWTGLVPPFLPHPLAAWGPLPCVCVGMAWRPVCLVAGTAARLPIFLGHVLEELYQHLTFFKLSTPAQAHLAFILLLPYVDAPNEGEGGAVYVLAFLLFSWPALSKE
jgi:hypothetical protein